MRRAGQPHDPLADFKVHEIKVLKGHDDAAKARALLEAVARQVQPILRRRQWRVPLLSEFSPKNPCLLGININRGQEIRIRLRRHNNPRDFYSDDHILGTMLHELTHIVHGPHLAPFYKLLDELNAEVDELIAKGVAGTGQGFDAPSAGRLGSHSFIPQHNPPDHRLRDVALKAAEERARKQALFPTGPRRLGGSPAAAAGLTPVQAAAAAAERRARDNVWCGGRVEDGGGPDAQDTVADRGEESPDEGRDPAAVGGSGRAAEPGGGSGGGSGSGGGTSGAQRASAAAAAAAARARAERGHQQRPGRREGTSSGMEGAAQAPAAPKSGDGEAEAAASRRREAEAAAEWERHLQRQRAARREKAAAGAAGHGALARRRAGPAGASDGGGNDVIDLTELDSGDEDAGGGSGSGGGAGGGGAGGGGRPLHWRLSSGAPGCPCCVPPVQGQWACPQCTYANEPGHLQCEICMGERPPKPPL